jgi:hypothetical protein
MKRLPINASFNRFLSPVLKLALFLPSVERSSK